MDGLVGAASIVGAAAITAEAIAFPRWLLRHGGPLKRSSSRGSLARRFAFTAEKLAASRQRFDGEAWQTHRLKRVVPWRLGSSFDSTNFVVRVSFLFYLS